MRIWSDRPSVMMNTSYHYFCLLEWYGFGVHGRMHDYRFDSDTLSRIGLFGTGLRWVPRTLTMMFESLT